MRTLLTRVVAALLAVAALVFPGFGVPDLLVTWDPAWQVMLEAGWGLFMTVLVAVPLLAVAVAPGRAAPAAVQLWTASACVLVSAAVARDSAGALLGAGLLVATALVTLLRGPGLRVRGRWQRPRGRVDVPLLALTVLAAGPWLHYALGEAAAVREGAVGADITVGVDHHVVQGGLALAFVGLPLLASLWGEGRRFLTACVAVAAAYLGLVALAHPVTPAAVGRPWSALVLAWSAGVLVAGWRARAGRTVAVRPASG